MKISAAFSLLLILLVQTLRAINREAIVGQDGSDNVSEKYS